jgi:hypothetical protein
MMMMMMMMMFRRPSNAIDSEQDSEQDSMIDFKAFNFGFPSPYLVLD